MSIEHSEFRLALGHFASGVTVITTQHQGQLHGTTVSSFCSLSLRPPLVLVGIDLKATIHDLIVASGVFAVNILAEHAGDSPDILLAVLLTNFLLCAPPGPAWCSCSKMPWRG